MGDKNPKKEKKKKKATEKPTADRTMMPVLPVPELVKKLKKQK